MVYDPVEKARRERVRYHKNKQKFLDEGGQMPSEIKRKKSKEEIDNYIIPSKNLTVIPSRNPFNDLRQLSQVMPKKKPVYMDNGIEKKKDDSAYADAYEKQNGATNSYKGFSFY